MAAHLWDGFPPSLRIGPHDTPIKIGPIAGDGKDDEAVLFGCFISSEQRIELSDAVPTRSVAVETCLHELFHSLLAPLSLTDDEEEPLCGVLGSGLAQVLRDNPSLLKWLAKLDDDCI